MADIKAESQGHPGQRAFNFILDFYYDLAKTRTPFLAATIAYYALFSVFPLILLVLSIGGELLSESVIVRSLIKNIGIFIPEFDRVILDNLVELSKSAASLGAIGILILMWSGTSIFSALEYSIDKIWKVEVARNILASKIISLAIFFVLAGLLLVSTLASYVILLIESTISSQGNIDFNISPYIHILSDASSWVLSFLVFGIIYKFLPNRNLGFRDIWVGLVLATLLWQLARIVFTLSIQRLGELQFVYGSIVAIIGLLMWFYVSALIFLLSAEVDYVRSVRKERKNANENRQTEIQKPVPELGGAG